MAEEAKIVALILHTHRQPERYNNIIHTWGSKIDYLFYSDGENLNTLKVTDRDDYLSAEVKQVNVINNLPDHFMEYDWFLFCDNDTFVNTDLLFKQIKNFDENKVYGEVIQSWPKDTSLKYLSGGAGYLMSSKILKQIKGNLKVQGSGFSDVTMGLYYRENKIAIENSKFFRSQKPEFFGIKDVTKHITFHYITTYSDMLELFNKCNDETKLVK